MEARTVNFELKYNKAPIHGEIGPDVQSITYVDCAADSSDSCNVEIDAQDSKWANAWMPDEGATLWLRIVGRNWYAQGDRHFMDCGLFTLDDLAYSDAPTTLNIGGVAKPNNSDFSELEREKVWKNTSVKRIGSTIAGRYGLGFSYDATDYSIVCWEQDGTDSSEYNELCKNYGLIMKVYSNRLWVFDRETYKKKAAAMTIYRTDIVKNSFNWKKGIAGTFTGGYFSYTDPDKDCDITASIGGGTRTKDISRYASSVADAASQLVAELNNANHGMTKATFKLPGNWSIASGMNINLRGFGSAIDGKYFVDKVTHNLTRSGGFTSSVECSLCTKAFSASDVGGSIVYNDKTTDDAAAYSSTYGTTVAAADAASTNAGATAGAAVTLENAPFYVSSTATTVAARKSGTFYYYDGILIAGRYRITISASRCGKLPVGENVTGWVPASYCK